MLFGFGSSFAADHRRTVFIGSSALSDAKRPQPFFYFINAHVDCLRGRRPTLFILNSNVAFNYLNIFHTKRKWISFESNRAVYCLTEVSATSAQDFASSHCKDLSRVNGESRKRTHCFRWTSVSITEFPIRHHVPPRTPALLIHRNVERHKAISRVM